MTNNEVLKDISENLPVDGAYFEEDPRTFEFGGSTDSSLDRARAEHYAPIHSPNPKYQYERNQRNLTQTRNFCTSVGPGCASITLAIQWAVKGVVARGNDTRLKFWNFAVANYWYVETSGYSMVGGVKCTIDNRNKEYPDFKLMYFRVGRWSEEMYRLLDLWYRLVVGHQYNRDYNYDRAVDGKLNNPSSRNREASTGGHINTIYKNQDDGKIYIIDNYEGRIYNMYEFAKEFHGQSSRVNPYAGQYPSVYFIVPAEPFDGDDRTLEDIKSQKTAVKKAIAYQNIASLYRADAEKKDNLEGASKDSRAQYGDLRGSDDPKKIRVATRACISELYNNVEDDNLKKLLSQLGAYMDSNK